MKNLFIWTALILATTFFTGCDDDDDGGGDCQGSLAIVAQGVEGCTVFDLEASDITLEPVNLDTLGLSLEVGERVCLTYVDFTGVSICQAGELVSIQTIEVVE